MNAPWPIFGRRELGAFVLAGVEMSARCGPWTHCGTCPGPAKSPATPQGSCRGSLASHRPRLLMPTKSPHHSAFLAPPLGQGFPERPGRSSRFLCVTTANSLAVERSYLELERQKIARDRIFHATLRRTPGAQERLAGGVSTRIFLAPTSPALLPVEFYGPPRGSRLNGFQPVVALIMVNCDRARRPFDRG